MLYSISGQCYYYFYLIFLRNTIATNNILVVRDVKLFLNPPGFQTGSQPGSDISSVCEGDAETCSGQYAFSCKTKYYQSETKSCVDNCDTGFDLVDDRFCYSHCLNFYNNNCYSCDEGYYRVIK